MIGSRSNTEVDACPPRNVLGLMAPVRWGAVAVLAAAGLPISLSTSARSEQATGHSAFDLREHPTLQAARQIARLDPKVLAALDARVDGWSVAGDARITSTGFLRGGPSGVSATLPFEATGERTVGLGRVARWTLAIHALDAQAVPAEFDQGRVIYRNAFEETDEVFLADESMVEEWLLLRSSAAPQRFSWAVNPAHGIAAGKQDGDGGITFVDRRGTGVLRIPPAFAIDAQGVTYPVILSWDSSAGQLTASLDHALLPHPVLIDPGFVESASWAKQVTTVNPTPRSAHTMAYNPVTQKITLFGGYGCTSPGSCAYLDDTYTWNWQTLDWQPVGGSAPPPRALSAMAADPGALGVVLFGGESTNAVELEDTWNLDATGWHTIPSTGPSFRSHHAVAYHNRTGQGARLVLATGSAGATPATTQWLFDSSSMPPVWMNDGTPTLPELRDAAMTSLTSASKVLLFGGQFCPTPVNCYQTPNTTYLLSSEGTWSLASLKGYTPGGRYAAAIAEDTLRERAVIFGGRTSSGVTYADPFEATSARFYERSISGLTPPTRAYPAMAFDPGDGRILLFGGTPVYSTLSPTQLQDHLGDTWALTVTSAACTEGSQCDTQHCVDGACCEVAACGVCETCGSKTEPGYCVGVKNGDHPSCAGTCDANGKCVVQPGSPCGPNADCSTGFCESGICCSSPCSAGCGECATGACLPLPMGSAPVSNCGDFLCSGADTVCPTSCDPAPCKQPLFCVSGACQSTLPLGSPCTSPAACGSGNCVEGVCCDTACDQPCDSCLAAWGAPADGQCSLVVAGRMPDPPGACGGKSCSGLIRWCICGVQMDCPAPYQCDGMTGECVATSLDAGIDSPSPEDAAADTSSGDVGSEANQSDGPLIDANSDATVGDSGRPQGECSTGEIRFPDGLCGPVPGPFDPATPTGCATTTVAQPTGTGVGMIAMGWAAVIVLALLRRAKEEGTP